MHLENWSRYDEEIETDTCLALANLWDDPHKNNFDCPWDWKGDQMAVIGKEELTKRLKGIERQGIDGKAGYHEIILMVARVLFESGIQAETARDIMYQASESVKRRGLQSSEIENAIKWAFDEKVNNGPRQQKIGIDTTLIAEYQNTVSLDALEASSDSKPNNMVKVLMDLYGPGRNIFLTDKPMSSGVIVNTSNMSMGNFIDPTGNELVRYICPCPLKDPDGGRVKENIQVHKYIIYESDAEGIKYRFDLQAGLISRLKKILPLKMVVHSGNKSLHAWYECEGQDPEKIQEFMNMGIRLGADPAVFRPNQLVRMPWAFREDNGKEQRIIYYAR